MTRDRLARWWRHTVMVERFVESGAWGGGHAPAEPLRCMVSTQTKVVRGKDGAEVVSTAQIAAPAGTAWVEPESRITLPDWAGGRSTRVLSCTVADGGGNPTPDHVLIACE